MIIGKSYGQKHKEEQAYLESIKDGVIWFAWYPVRENYGQWAWLQKVRLDYGIYECPMGLLERGSGRRIVHLIAIEDKTDEQ